MFSHVHIGITDFERAFAFYSGVMDELGFTLKFSEPEKPWAGWMQPGRDRPLFLIGRPYNGKRAAPGNGQMVKRGGTTPQRSTHKIWEETL